jgi:phosphatidylglycerophosphatase A
MVLKQSSDELNRITIVGEDSPLPRPPSRTAKDFLALAIATCGVGYLPLAPGTWGSLLAVGVFFYAHVKSLGCCIDTLPVINPLFFFIGLPVAIVTTTFLGMWAASRTERVLRIKDPGKVVIDEVAGQLIALLPLALSWVSPLRLIVAFVLFRFFDIVKPYPARKFESLHGGLGIMADDLVAGAYAAIIVGLLMQLRWFS